MCVQVGLLSLREAVSVISALGLFRRPNHLRPLGSGVVEQTISSPCIKKRNQIETRLVAPPSSDIVYPLYQKRWIF